MLGEVLNGLLLVLDWCELMFFEDGVNAEPGGYWSRMEVEKVEEQRSAEGHDLYEQKSL